MELPTTCNSIPLATELLPLLILTVSNIIGFISQGRHLVSINKAIIITTISCFFYLKLAAGKQNLWWIEMTTFLKWSKLSCIHRSRTWDIWEDWSLWRVQGPLAEQGVRQWSFLNKDCINLQAFMSLCLSCSAFMADDCISKVHLRLSEHFLKTVATTLRYNVTLKTDLRPNLLLIHIICL